MIGGSRTQWLEFCLELDCPSTDSPVSLTNTSCVNLGITFNLSTLSSVFSRVNRIIMVYLPHKFVVRIKWVCTYIWHLDQCLARNKCYRSIICIFIINKFHLGVGEPFSKIHSADSYLLCLYTELALRSNLEECGKK